MQGVGIFTEITVLTKVLMKRKVYFLSNIRIIPLLLACLKFRKGFLEVIDHSQMPSDCFTFAN